MAATQPNLAFAPTRSSPPTSAGSFVGRCASAVVALASVGVGLAMCSAYPVMPLLAIGLLLAWTAFAALLPWLAVPALLTLLPVVGFATWTGWLTFEELDVMVLASAAGAYAAFAWSGRDLPIEPGERRFLPQLSIFSMGLLLVFFVSQAISLLRGFSAGGGFRFDWFQSYFDPLNSLRIFKAFAWALLLTPLLLRDARRPGFFDRISLAMMAALGLCSLVVIQERIAFTGLLDFSEDYRATGPFWENHVGGVALEGFLAITIPFAVRCALLPARTPLEWGRVVAAGAVLVAAGYACFVTFTRGLYIAVPISMLLLALLVGRQRPRGKDTAHARPLLLYGAVLAVLACTCAFVVFRHGGYRTVLAMLIASVFAVPVEASLRRGTMMIRLTGVVAAILVGAFVLLVELALPKAAYVSFAAICLVTGAALLRAAQRPSAATEIAVIGGWLGMVLCACVVALHWGGNAAFQDCTAAAAVLIILSLTTVVLRRPIHPTGRQAQLLTGGFIALLMGSVAVFNAGAYAGGRLNASSSDMSARLNHWRSGIDQLRGDDWAFGKGLGRFPATSLFEVMDVPPPGSEALVRRNGENFVRITSPHLPYIGNDELFRFSQRITPRPHTRYRITVNARAAVPTAVHFEICEKHLIYPRDCVGVERSIGGTKEWQRFDFSMETGNIGASDWYAPRPVFFAIGPYDPPGGSVDVRLVRMIGPDGVDVLSNGDFSNRTARWFSSSDKYHLPWRIENMYLDVLFGQGLLGLAVFSLLIVAALLRTTLGRAARHPDAPYVAAAITAASIVGVFDSLTDAPRVALLFYLVILLGLMLRNPRIATTVRRRDVEPRIATTVRRRDVEPRIATTARRRDIEPRIATTARRPADQVS